MTASITVIAETGSTNADLAARLTRGDPVAEGAWLVADRQSAGRGRQGRAWLDGAGNFMGSTTVRIGPHDPPVATLSFVAALAVYEAVLPRIADPAALQLKWPNDLLLGGAKLSGILLERVRDHAVIGIGVNLAAAPAFTDRKVAAVAASGPAPDRDGFAHDLAASMEREVQAWRLAGTEPLFRRWLAAAHPPGTLLAVHDPEGNRVSGTFAGLAEDGALRLCLADGTTHVIRAGDVSMGG